MRNFSPIGQLFLAAWLLSSQSTAQAPQPHAQKKNATQEHEFRSNLKVPIVSIDAEVISGSTGEVVSDLTHEDFIISENGVHQKVFAWEHRRKPMSLLIVVDSAAGDPNTHTVGDQINALKASLINELEPGDEVSIMGIGERPSILVDHTSDKHLISAALEGVSQQKTVSKLSAEKRLSRGLHEAADHARGVQDPYARCAVILISDLPEKAADELILPKEVVRAMIESRSVFCSNGSANFSPPFSDEDKSSLDRVSFTGLIGLTGGEIVNSDWKSFLERLRGRYRIVYLPFTRWRRGQVVRIKLDLKPSPKRDTNDLVLNYPRIAIIPSGK